MCDRRDDQSWNDHAARLRTIYPVYIFQTYIGPKSTIYEAVVAIVTKPNLVEMSLIFHDV